MTTKAHKSNFENEDLNPCLQESKLSQRCLDKALYDYSKCEHYFQNYKICKKFWRQVSLKRYQAGIEPKMPCKKERERILQMRKDGVKVISAKKV